MADAAATGPAAQTPWRMTLLRELVTRVQRIYDRGHMGIELAQQLADRVDAVRELLGDEPEPVVERFVLDMPRGYFLAIEPRSHRAPFPHDRASRRIERGADRGHARRAAGHLRAAGRRGRPPGAVVVDRRGRLARRALDPHGAGVHDRRRCGGRPVRGRGRVRSRGRRASVAGVPQRAAQGRRRTHRRWSTVSPSKRARYPPPARPWMSRSRSTTMRRTTRP